MVPAAPDPDPSAPKNPPGTETVAPARRRRPVTTGRRRLVSGNWKMHHDHIEALHTVRDLGLRLKPADVASVDVSVHPPFTDLRTVQTLLEGEAIPVALGAQHCYHVERGAFTGEVSPQMLARMGTAYVLVGHSERRHLFAMTDEEVAATLRAVLSQAMTPVCCVGETEEERAAGRTEAVLSTQLRAALGGLGPDVLGGLVLAYEPVWAIGTGRSATRGGRRGGLRLPAGPGGGAGRRRRRRHGADPVRGLGDPGQCGRAGQRARRGRAAGRRRQSACGVLR